MTSSTPNVIAQFRAKPKKPINRYRVDRDCLPYGQDAYWETYDYYTTRRKAVSWAKYLVRTGLAEQSRVVEL